MSKNKEENLEMMGFESKDRIIKRDMKKTVKALHKQWVKSELDFDLAIQRGEVWNLAQKTNLIYSILYGHYIPSVVSEIRVGDVKIYFLDGKQRLTTIMKFIDGDWALSKRMDDIHGASFAGYKFKDLPEDIQDIIYDENISITTMENMTDEERDRQFVFLNMGSELNQMEKTRAMYSDLINGLEKMADHSFMIDFLPLTNRARVRFSDQEIILQIALLVEKGVDGIKGFGSSHIRNYVLELKEKNELFSDKFTKRVLDVFDYLETVVMEFSDEERKQALKRIHVPIIFHVAEEAMKEGVKGSDFGAFILKFLVEDYSVESKYGVACQSGSAKKENIKIRVSEMKKAFDKTLNKSKSAGKTADKTANKEVEKTAKKSTEKTVKKTAKKTAKKEEVKK